jgi:hypothetical protein
MSILKKTNKIQKTRFEVGFLGFYCAGFFGRFFIANPDSVGGFTTVRWVTLWRENSLTVLVLVNDKYRAMNARANPILYF